MVLLDGLNRQLILNLDDDAIEANKYPGIKVGSTEENNNNDGNWDKEIEVIILKNK
jgi:squalene cyclase